MASSSQNNFDEAFDDAFEDTFDEAFDDGFDQAFEHLTIHLDQEERRQKRKKRAYIERHREEGHIRLWNDYFSETPTYLPNLFRRRFRMNKSLFMHIVDRLSNEVQYFRETHDALGRKSLSPLQKCTAAIRVLAYGSAADTVDEYLRLGSSTTRLCVENFVDGIINLFGEEYLRRPTEADLQRLLYVAECRGFPGMIGSIDCIHWEWKNCPSAWKGQYARGSGKPTIVLEAVASFDLWIWHAFFGLPGNMIWLTILPMVYIRNGQLLSNLFLYHKDPKQFYLLNGKKLTEKMSSVLLESCKLVLPLLKIQSCFGIESKLER
ncbi:uncharacterized protein LOC108840392 isoform X3 [Raphanus sativus]|uniref:Uncharacterized protein LOC108840392 isoform X3 n=1 Tax=Raphanus sativus TaxID=3726 RepID=A0A9W3CE63_RAPSA|nr:uncharacterized protein LOC108840392 isoform X3 [Raphanus sativus]